MILVYSLLPTLTVNSHRAANLPILLLLLTVYSTGAGATAADGRLSAAARALKRVDVVHPLDEHRPSGHRAQSGASGSQLLCFDRRTIVGQTQNTSLAERTAETVSAGAAGKSRRALWRDRPRERHSSVPVR